MSKNLPDIPLEEAKEILDAIEKQLKNRFQEIFDEKYNQNTKGFDYEQLLGEFLQEYLGGAFNFLIRVGVIDNELMVNSVLEKTQNEFDIVAIYKQATPKLVHHRLIPYDSVAFIIEAKQTLSISKLEKDLKKFDKLRKLQVFCNRVRNNYPTSFQIGRPLRVLFYFEKHINIKKFCAKLTEFNKAWDICIILKENITILNSTLPYVQQKIQKDYPKALTLSFVDYPLLKAMFFISNFIESNFLNSWTLFANLFRITEQIQMDKCCKKDIIEDK